MKKIITTLLILSLTLTLGGVYKDNKAKADQVLDIGILGEWEDNDAPDYYGGLRYDSEQDLFIVYLKENTQENQQTVLNGTVGKKMKIIFQTCKYSRNELKVVKAQLHMDDDKYEGIVAYGIQSFEVSTGVREPRVVVSVMHKDFESVSKLMIEKYGDKVVVQDMGDSVPVLDVEKTPTNNNKNEATELPKKVTIKTVKLSKKKLQIKWKKISSAKKYKVTILNKKWKKLVSKVTKKTSYTYKTKKKVAKRYTVKIKAYDATTKSWGKWTTKVVKRK